MSDIAIQVENLGKRYLLRHQQTGGNGLRHVLQDKLTAPFRSLKEKFQRRNEAHSSTSSFLPSTSTEEFWALKDVSFEVKQGEVVGIIGRNGAGKSTLLKILSRITEPTTGRITLDGRVASLLEVGTGFHPDLTGRENIFLNGAILGMARSEIRRQFDEIVAFAEIERFLDTPVKRYSSGMYVRLAFSVAAHLEPEILVVDEVLAVGDAGFQQKCLGRMEAVSKKEGRTVLFVSHNMPAVEALCTKAILIDAGRVKTTGPSPAVISEHMRTMTERARASLSNRTTKHIRSFVLRSTDGEARDAFGIGEDIAFEVDFHSETLIDHPRYGIAIYSPRGERVATLHTDVQQKSNWRFAGDKQIRALWRNVPLNTGNYRLDISLWDYANELETLVDCKTLEIQARDVYGTGTLPDSSYQGYLIPDVQWEMNSSPAC